MHTDPTVIEERGQYIIVYRGEGDFAAMRTRHWATTDQHVNCVGCEYVAEGCDTAAEVRAAIDKFAPFTECAYCARDITDRRNEAPPLLDDDAAWSELAREHAPDCEWIATRAHRRDATKGAG